MLEKILSDASGAPGPSGQLGWHRLLFAQSSGMVRGGIGVGTLAA